MKKWTYTNVYTIESSNGPGTFGVFETSAMAHDFMMGMQKSAPAMIVTRPGFIEDGFERVFVNNQICEFCKAPESKESKPQPQVESKPKESMRLYDIAKESIRIATDADIEEIKGHIESFEELAYQGVFETNLGCFLKKHQIEYLEKEGFSVIDIGCGTHSYQISWQKDKQAV